MKLEVQVNPLHLAVLCLLILIIGFLVHETYISKEATTETFNRDYLTFNVRTMYMNMDSEGRFYMSADELVMEKNNGEK